MKVYYNEIDPKACAWLRALIKRGLIPTGDVDERSIIDVKPEALEGYEQCHFFAGIGGWSLALRLARWPNKRQIWTASCPCQPLSCAGLGKGHADERHLWPAFYWLVAECKPPTIIGEQVSSKDGREWFSGVRADLEGMGYAVGSADLCSAGVGAPNIRQRLYWVADSDGRQSSDGELQRGGRHLQQSKDETAVRMEDSNGGGCAAGSGTESEREKSKGRDSVTEQRSGSQRMGEPIRTGLEGHARNGDDRHEPGRERETAPRSIATASDVGGVGNTESNGWIERRAESGRPERATEASRMVNTNGTGSQSGEQTGAAMGHRSSAESASGGVGNATGSRPITAQQGPEGEARNEARLCGPECGRSENFWSESVWHLCRDGKHRRIPAQSRIQSMAPGLPDFMDSRRISWITRIKERIIEYAAQTTTDTEQILRTLWDEFNQKTEGRTIPLPEKEILLTAVRELQGALGHFDDSAPPGVVKASEDIMRSLWNHSQKSKTPARSSSGRKRPEQSYGQLRDSLRQLSQKGALEQNQIESCMTGFPLSARLPGRVAMLRGFGNAINPEVAAQFIRAYIEIVTT